jgi:hypothetical protein
MHDQQTRWESRENESAKPDTFGGDTPLDVRDTLPSIEDRRHAPRIENANLAVWGVCCVVAYQQAARDSRRDGR